MENRRVKKPIYKRKWLIVVCVLFVSVAIGIIKDKNASLSTVTESQKTSDSDLAQTPEASLTVENLSEGINLSSLDADDKYEGENIALGSTPPASPLSDSSSAKAEGAQLSSVETVIEKDNQANTQANTPNETIAQTAKEEPKSETKPVAETEKDNEAKAQTEAPNETIAQTVKEEPKSETKAVAETEKDNGTKAQTEAPKETIAQTAKEEPKSETKPVAETEKTSKAETPKKAPATSAKTSSSSSNTSKSSNSSQQKTSASYVLNTSTKKFHRPSCSSVSQIKASNYATGSNCSDIINRGYTPCKRCNP